MFKNVEVTCYIPFKITDKMKLTKDQRYTAYCIMLEEAEVVRFDGDGFCRFSSPWGLCELLDKKVTRKLQLRELEELFDKKPTQFISCFWFPYNRNGWKQRISLLKQCIEETSDF